MLKELRFLVCEPYDGQLETCDIRALNDIAVKKGISKNSRDESQSFGIYRQDQIRPDNSYRGEFGNGRFNSNAFIRPGGTRQTIVTPRGQLGCQLLN
jgi:hypothetical protein